jgi:hypothetical protein
MAGEEGASGTAGFARGTEVPVFFFLRRPQRGSPAVQLLLAVHACRRQQPGDAGVGFMIPLFSGRDAWNRSLQRKRHHTTSLQARCPHSRADDAIQIERSRLHFGAQADTGPPDDKSRLSNRTGARGTATSPCSNQS